MERKSTLIHPCNRDSLLLRSDSRSVTTTSSDLALQWGNRKRVRCMKVQPKNPIIIDDDRTGTVTAQRSTTRIGRRVVWSDLNNYNKSKPTNNAGKSNAYLQHLASDPPRRILRNTEFSIGMKGQSNGVRGVLISPDRGDRKGTSASTSNNNIIHYKNGSCNQEDNEDHRHSSGGGGGAGSLDAGCDGRRDGCNEKAALWLPNFVITLTNKEKEEDFLAIKGCKLPQRPKKRAKVIQRTLNLVCPGAWLSDLTLERYQVREKKVSKKRPRGLKAMMGNNMDSDSEQVG